MLSYAHGLVALVAGALLLQGCGGDSDPYEDADPRCAAACAIVEPPLEGAFDICSRDSARDCLDQCATRIEDVAPLCATCLVESAQFGNEADGGPQTYCDYDRCWLMNTDGDYCEFPPNDQRAEEDCLRQLYPREEIACTVRWRPVVDCAEVCG